MGINAYVVRIDRLEYTHGTPFDTFLGQQCVWKVCANLVSEFRCTAAAKLFSDNPIHFEEQANLFLTAS